MYKNYNYILAHSADKYREISIMNRYCLQAAICRQARNKSQDIRKIIFNKGNLPYKQAFSPQAWMNRLTTFIVASQLPFMLVGYSEFCVLIEMAYLALSTPKIPTAKIIYCYLQQKVQEY
ncbi:uncharacterized protein BO66DRAFT_460223 [Aspergillus aculeatinus CBS 121060]|uniref:Uncharacterized protein n=1 Tax=Aspergillus aculeatinus CBS 121060 TaxID=1448322 RepID=A0ACD1GYJ8_9EURO|nr:hypothetical protein BO66DRAFT_460223 [Aspergillus aculeatinus CBS 121060]RAH66420.1 hypothetical protein BO66DRAFT_460223 [Aspergillus aculeatinus CBS 121060]